jgi:hypothetical protein
MDIYYMAPNFFVRAFITFFSNFQHVVFVIALTVAKYLL